MTRRGATAAAHRRRTWRAAAGSPRSRGSTGSASARGRTGAPRPAPRSRRRRGGAGASLLHDATVPATGPHRSTPPCVAHPAVVERATSRAATRGVDGFRRLPTRRVAGRRAATLHRSPRPTFRRSGRRRTRRRPPCTGGVGVGPARVTPAPPRGGSRPPPRPRQRVGGRPWRDAAAASGPSAPGGRNAARRVRRRRSRACRR